MNRTADNRIAKIDNKNKKWRESQNNKKIISLSFVMENFPASIFCAREKALEWRKFDGFVKANRENKINDNS